MKTKVVFIGGLTNGKIVYDYLSSNKHVDLCLAFTYPDDHEYPHSVPFADGDKIVKTLRVNDHLEKIRQAKPDFIFVAGWSELISDEITTTARLGTIGFHPSKLPKDRGRSVLAWQIEEGYTETALTMFYYSAFPDGGDIIAQEVFRIEDNDYISDVIDKVEQATYSLMRAYFPLLRQGIAPRKTQDLTEGNFRRLRTVMDSQVNWNQNSSAIYNKIRAISSPYPCAVAKIGGDIYKVLRADPINTFPFGGGLQPGELVSKLYDGSMIVKTRDGFLRVTEFFKIEK